MRSTWFLHRCLFFLGCAAVWMRLLPNHWHEGPFTKNIRDNHYIFLLRATTVFSEPASGLHVPCCPLLEKEHKGTNRIGTCSYEIYCKRSQISLTNSSFSYWQSVQTFPGRDRKATPPLKNNPTYYLFLYCCWQGTVQNTQDLNIKR